MSDQLPALEAFGSALLGQLEPTRRRELARRIASNLRSSQQKRIAAQQNPDGTPYAERKPQLRHKIGKIKRQMFAKLRTARHLKARGDGEGATVAFTDAASRIARIHQFGLRDKVNRRTGLEVTYAQRELLGVTPEDEAMIRDLSTAWLTGER